MDDLGRFDDIDARRSKAARFAVKYKDGGIFDGRGNIVEECKRAHVVLVAPSRHEKTPTAYYLALEYMLLVVCIPYVGQDLEKILREFDLDRVVMLELDAKRVQERRRRRQRWLAGDPHLSNYLDLEFIEAEQLELRRIAHRLGCHHLCITGVATEETAAAIAKHLGFAPAD